MSCLAVPLQGRRLGLVELAFKSIDKDGSGIIEPAELMGTFNTKNHPEVIAGRKHPDQILREFLETFEVGGVIDGKVTRQEFLNYYKNISASIDDDDYFELMMRNAWHISGGEGWCANSSNKRVLVTHADGRQTVEEVPDDLGLRPDDTDSMILHLRKKGIQVSDIKTFGGGDFGPGKRKLTANPAQVILAACASLRLPAPPCYLACLFLPARQLLRILTPPCFGTGSRRWPPQPAGAEPYPPPLLALRAQPPWTTP